MSLSVDVYVYDEAGDSKFIDLEKGKNLAGFESCRQKLYGSKLAESLGLRLFIQLKNDNLWAARGELDELDREADIILVKSRRFSEDSGFEEEYVKARIQNVKDVIKKARELNGGIVIW